MFRQKRKRPIPGLAQKGRYYVLPAEGHVVCRCAGLVIEFDDDKGTTISVAQPFVFAEGDVEEQLDPADSETVQRLALLEGIRAIEARADDSGRLMLRFENGVRVDVPPSSFEAWEFKNRQLLHIVSVAGGGLAIWGEQQH